MVRKIWKSIFEFSLSLILRNVRLNIFLPELAVSELQNSLWTHYVSTPSMRLQSLVSHKEQSLRKLAGLFLFPSWWSVSVRETLIFLRETALLCFTDQSVYFWEETISASQFLDSYKHSTRAQLTAHCYKQAKKTKLSVCLSNCWA